MTETDRGVCVRAEARGLRYRACEVATDMRARCDREGVPGMRGSKLWEGRDSRFGKIERWIEACAWLRDSEVSNVVKRRVGQ